MEDNSVEITLQATDTFPGPLTFLVVNHPAHGTFGLVDNVVTYTPDPDYVGEDSFTFTAGDAYTESTTAMVTITVTPVNDSPHAVDDDYFVNENGVLQVAAPGVMDNDIEVDTDGMVVTLVDNVGHGTLVLLGDGSFTYTPEPGFAGIDTFVYSLVTYPGLLSAWTDEATVTITVIDDMPYRFFLPFIMQ